MDSRREYKIAPDYQNHTSSFWCPGRFLLISGFTAVVILFLPTGCPHRAKQHAAGLEEGHQERLFGLRPVPPDDSSRFYVDASSFQKHKVNKAFEPELKARGILKQFTTTFMLSASHKFKD